MLAVIDVLKVDSVEAQTLIGETDIRNAALKLHALLGPKEIVLAYSDGLLVFVENQIYEQPSYQKSISGHNDRGDTCIASYMTKRLSASPATATVWAAAVTSLKMEAEGPIIRQLSEVEEFIRKMY